MAAGVGALLGVPPREGEESPPSVSLEAQIAALVRLLQGLALGC